MVAMVIPRHCGFNLQTNNKQYCLKVFLTSNILVEVKKFWLKTLTKMV